MILAIDPGTQQSAYLVWTGEKIIDMGILDNDEVLRIITDMSGDIVLAIEMPQCFGMSVGKSVFETIFWIGRFCQAWKGGFSRIYRSQIKMHFCNSMRAKDTNIRQAILDKFGGKEKAIGRKSNPGVFYGVKYDMWQALALAIYWEDKSVEKT